MRGVMDDVFEEVLALCLDRIEDGDSAEACAADFPDFPDLLSLLELATALRSMPREEPRRSWLGFSINRVAQRARRRRLRRPR